MLRSQKLKKHKGTVPDYKRLKKHDGQIQHLIQYWILDQKKKSYYLFTFKINFIRGTTSNIYIKSADKVLVLYQY